MSVIFEKSFNETATFQEIIENALHILKDKYDSAESGLCLLKLDDKYQLCSKKEYADSIRKVIEVKKNAPLSQAAFEVLAIIAYNQPITKPYIEQIRGVDCSGVVNTLCQKELVEEKAKEIEKICHSVKLEKAKDKVMSCSIGVAIYPETGMDYNELFEKSDEAMYYVKKHGKNGYAFAE